MNDKITVRVWSEGSAFSSDDFIANMPEFPSENDYFNISKLLAIEGRLKPTWINLYGIHPDGNLIFFIFCIDRGWFVTKSYNKKEGSVFLGRVLITMQLLPHERPSLMVQSSTPVKEPA